MRQAFPNILKFIGALAVTTAIFFLLSPEEEIDDKVFNTSMEFLGSKLLAMVPQERKPEVEKEFEAFREQTRNGKVSDKQFEGLAVTILNAEAEGRQLEQHEIDSMLAAIKHAEVVRAEDEVRRREELVAMSERLQAFQEFEHQWKKIIPPMRADSAAPRPPQPPLYRIAKNFVIEIDTAAIAEIAVEHAEHFAALAPVTPPHEVYRVLTRELPRLKFEVRKIKRQHFMADSMQMHFGQQFEFDHQIRQAMVGVEIADSVLKAFEKNPRYQLQIRRAMLQAQRADSLGKAGERYYREPRKVPVPPLPPETPQPEKTKPPQ